MRQIEKYSYSIEVVNLEVTFSWVGSLILYYVYDCCECYTSYVLYYTRRSSAKNSGKNENMCVRWAVDEPLYCLSLCIWNDVRLFVHGRRKNQGRGEEEVSVIGKVLKFASARRLRREGGIIRLMIKFSIFYYINPIKKQFDTTSMYLLGTSPTKKTVPPPLYASTYISMLAM